MLLAVSVIFGIILVLSLLFSNLLVKRLCELQKEQLRTSKDERLWLLEYLEESQTNLLNRLASSNWGSIAITPPGQEPVWNKSTLVDPDGPSDDDIVYEEPLDLSDDWAKLDLPNPNPVRDQMPEFE